MGNKSYTILVIEPNNNWYEKTKQSLEKRDYSVERIKKSSELSKACEDKLPSLILLEHDLSPSDGVELAMEIRDDSNLKTVPLVFYSENTDKYTQIAAYEAGADMYIKKGIKSRLLLAQIAAILRRTYDMSDNGTDIRIYGDIVIDEDQVTVHKNGKPLELSKKEFQLLLLLSSKPGKVFRRPNILKKIWGDDVIVGDRNIDTHIKKLRKKLGKEYIQTSRGMGYKFNA